MSTATAATTTQNNAEVPREPTLTPVSAGADQNLQQVRYEDRLLDRPTAARWLGLHPDTLTNWARQGRGPKVTFIGRYRVRYFVRDILAWAHAQADCTPELRRKHSGAGRDRAARKAAAPGRRSA